MPGFTGTPTRGRRGATTTPMRRNALQNPPTRGRREPQSLSQAKKRGFGPQPGPQARTARPQPSKAQQIAGLRGIGAGRPSPTQPAARRQARDIRQDARRQARDTRQQARTARQDARRQARTARPQPSKAQQIAGLRGIGAGRPSPTQPAARPGRYTRPAPKRTARPTARPAGLRKFKEGGVVGGGAKSINGIAKRGLTRAPQAKHR
jgi:hypothetical protein